MSKELKPCGKCGLPEGNFTCGDMSCITGRNNLERLRVANMEKELTKKDAAIQELAEALNKQAKEAFGLADELGVECVLGFSSQLTAERYLKGENYEL